MNVHGTEENGIKAKQFLLPAATPSFLPAPGGPQAALTLPIKHKTPHLAAAPSQTLLPDPAFPRFVSGLEHSQKQEAGFGAPTPPFHTDGFLVMQSLGHRALGRERHPNDDVQTPPQTRVNAKSPPSCPLRAARGHLQSDFSPPQALPQPSRAWYLLFMILMCRSSSCFTSGCCPLLWSLSWLSSLWEKMELSSFLGTLVGGRGIVLFSARRPRFWDGFGKEKKQGFGEESWCFHKHQTKTRLTLSKSSFCRAKAASQLL